jgi:hypothetical protein
MSNHNYLFSLVGANTSPGAGRTFFRSKKARFYAAFLHASIRLNTERSGKVPIRDVENPWNMITVRSVVIHKRKGHSGTSPSCREPLRLRDVVE